VLGLFACFNIQDTAEGYVVNKTYCNCTCESADSRQRKEKYKRNEKRWRGNIPVYYSWYSSVTWDGMSWK